MKIRKVERGGKNLFFFPGTKRHTYPKLSQTTLFLPTTNKGVTYNSMMLKKSNQIIEAFMQLSRVQQRIFCIAVNDFMNYSCCASIPSQTFKVADVRKAINLEIGKEYKKVKKEICDLTDKYIVQRFTRKKFRIFTECKYNDGRGSYCIKFSPDMVNCLNDLKKGFTILDINYLLNFKSIYSVRLYEILKQYEKLKKRKVNIDDLKFLLGIEDKYSRYYNFKKRALEPAIADINKNTDIYIEYEEVKNGKSVENLIFTISKTNNKAEERFVPRSYINKFMASSLNEDTSFEKLRDEGDQTTEIKETKEEDFAVVEIARTFPTYIDIESAKEATIKMLSKYPEDVVARNVRYATRRVKFASKYFYYLQKAIDEDWGKQESSGEYFSDKELEVLNKFDMLDD